MMSLDLKLYHASISSRLEDLKKYIRAGANVNAVFEKDKEGNPNKDPTALCRAFNMKDLTNFKYLLSQGAYPYSIDHIQWLDSIEKLRDVYSIIYREQLLICAGRTFNAAQGDAFVAWISRRIGQIPNFKGTTFTDSSFSWTINTLKKDKITLGTVSLVQTYWCSARKVLVQTSEEVSQKRREATESQYFSFFPLGVWRMICEYSIFYIPIEQLSDECQTPLRIYQRALGSNCPLQPSFPLIQRVRIYPSR